MNYRHAYKKWLKEWKKQKPFYDFLHKQLIGYYQIELWDIADGALYFETFENSGELNIYMDNEDGYEIAHLHEDDLLWEIKHIEEKCESYKKRIKDYLEK